MTHDIKYFYFMSQSLLLSASYIPLYLLYQLIPISDNSENRVPEWNEGRKLISLTSMVESLKHQKIFI